MTAFLETLGARLAERWLALLVAPGALYLALAAAATSLGHRRWRDVSLLQAELDRAATGPVASSVGALVLAAAGVLAAAAGFGLAARALGGVVERVWLMDAHGVLTRALAGRRRARWDRAQREFQSALVAAGQAQLAGAPDAGELVRRAEQHNAARHRIGAAPPHRPFWLGDRLAAVDHRIHTRYGLDLASVWPRLWLVAPEPTRAELSAARAALGGATRLVAWGLGIAALGVIWWPALVIGAITVTGGWWRGRSAGTALADLLESAVDIHGRLLAESVGVACPARLTPEIGAVVTGILRKDT